MEEKSQTNYIESTRVFYSFPSMRFNGKDQRKTAREISADGHRTRDDALQIAIGNLESIKRAK